MPLMYRIATVAKTLIPPEVRRRFLRPSNFWVWDLPGVSGELPDFRVSLRRIRSSGYAPGLIIDVGAWNGEWTETAHAVWPESEILMVEAIEEKFLALRNKVAKKPRQKVAHAVLSGVAGESREFHQMGTGSSLFPELSDLPREVKRITTETLDSVVSRHYQRRESILLKLDVQGAELSILKGAQETLKATQWLVLEVSLVPTNAEAPIFHEVISQCHQWGFLPADFAGFHRDPITTELRQVDLVFSRARE
jgi:FkbM family methyltransferase